MLLTYKIKHKRDFRQELEKARQVASFGLQTRSRTSRDVKEMGLPSAISNQILKKYSSNKKIKKVRRVKLTVPGQAIKVDRQEKIITIRCLKLMLEYYFRNDFEKINQIEIDEEYAYVSVLIAEAEEIQVSGYLGVDLNTTGHCAVAANPQTGKVLKLGKKAAHIHKKYSFQRKSLQKQGKFGKVEQLEDREKRIVKDLTHKASTTIVRYAKEHGLGIQLEDLQGIRKRARASISFKYLLHSWSYYGLQKQIEYKAKLLGIPVLLVDPSYTSQDCSKCHLRGNRQGKLFKCPHCRHFDHADVNASFNIAMRHGQRSIERRQSCVQRAH